MCCFHWQTRRELLSSSAVPLSSTEPFCHSVLIVLVSTLINVVSRSSRQLFWSAVIDVCYMSGTSSRQTKLTASWFTYCYQTGQFSAQLGYFYNWVGKNWFDLVVKIWNFFVPLGWVPSMNSYCFQTVREVQETNKRGTEEEADACQCCKDYRKLLIVVWPIYQQFLRQQW